MQFITVLCYFVGLLRGLSCYIFDDNNETEILNTECDKGEGLVGLGNIGQTPRFPWLGVLRVHIHEQNSMKIALTGVVLVTKKFAIANAYDVSKIPKSALLMDSKVMFITSQNEPWYCKVSDFMAHPEYEVTTYNTVGILELYSDALNIDPSPICWPTVNFNTSDELYVIGYTDENQLLEKSIYHIQYLDKTLCDEFYKRSHLKTGDLSDPQTYQCGFDINSRNNCSWENGRAVASNSSGYWTLIGLVLSGPGCSAPFRFLDTTAYMPWLFTTMSIDEQSPPDDIRDQPPSKN